MAEPLQAFSRYAICLRPNINRAFVKAKMAGHPKQSVDKLPQHNEMPSLETEALNHP
jgi:hypothetical protein